MHEHEPSAAPHAQSGAAAPPVHSHAPPRAVVHRRSRAIGPREAVRRMVENGQACAEVLIQLAAVRSALTSTGKLILQDHLEHCIVDAIERGDREPVDQLMKAIEQFVK